MKTMTAWVMVAPEESNDDYWIILEIEGETRLYLSLDLFLDFSIHPSYFATPEFSSLLQKRIVSLLPMPESNPVTNLC